MLRLVMSVFLGLFVLGGPLTSVAEAARPPAGKVPKSVGSLFKPNAYGTYSDGTPKIKRGSAPGAVKVEVDRNSQKMNVYVGGKLLHTWPVSTGRKGFNTPGGAYRPTWMTAMWRSKQWNNAPMPHAVFFREGYAIHATNETGRLGRPASHGCVRLAPKNAAKLFQMIRAHGEKKTSIVVS
jgi:lipoprotein-anchoring transpeptidase ErfK/SrfK